MQGVGFAVIFPITFIASTFVPVETLPPVLRTVAEWNPVSTMAESLRKLFGNPGVQVDRRPCPGRCSTRSSTR